MKVTALSMVRDLACVREIMLATLIVLAASMAATTAAAQSPNTGSVIITVSDQTGAVIPGADISVRNVVTGAVRNGVTGADGSATIAALPLVGEYSVKVSAKNFAGSETTGISLRSGETASIKVHLAVGGTDPISEVQIFGTAEGVRADPQIGLLLETRQIDAAPILGRKFSSIPLLNSAFRQGKGTGDLFVNQTYFITGVGSRRTTTTTIDGANNDEAWGRQAMMATIPVGAVQEVHVLTNAFSSEFGWTSGPALNIVTKSGTNSVHGEGVFLARPGGMQAKSFSTKGFCPSSVPTCVTPSTLMAINPVDIPDALVQYSASIGGPIIKDRTFYFLSGDYTRQDRTTFLSPVLPVSLRPADGGLDYTGHYRQGLLDARLDHRLTSSQNLMIRTNFDRFYDDNPQDAVSGTNAPSSARKYSRASWTTQVNHTWVINSNLLNEVRFAFLNGDPVTKWEAQTLSTAYTRGGSAPFTVGQSRLTDVFGRQLQFSDTLSWTTGKHYLRFGGSIVRHTSGGTGNEPGTPTLGTFTFVSTGPRATLPFDQLLLSDAQSYTQPISFGISSYRLTQWLVSGFVQDSFRVRRDLTVDLGLRYDRQTLTTAKANFTPRIGFGWNPNGDARLAIRGGYGMYYTQIQSNLVASYLVNGLDGLASYTANNGQPGFPTCLSGPCLPVVFDPHTASLPARDITIQAGQRDFYRAQFAKYGLNFDLLPNYPDKFVNPRSQVFTLGVEREFLKGLFVGADYVHQHLSSINRTVDLNAPSPFDRTGVGQCRAANCNNTASVTAANLTRPILPVVNGVRQVNVLMNLGVADYDGLQTQISYRGHSRISASLSYTLSKATNTSEPDGNGVAPNDSNIARLDEQERGPSLVDQRHRAVIIFSYRFPLGFTAGTLTQLASARPFNATTGVDNNGDGANNDRPVVDGKVMAKSAFRGTSTSDVSVFAENRIKLSERMALLLRIESFNILNHANMLGRGQTIYGNSSTPNADFGWFVSGVGATANAIPAFANIDPPRMFQLQARFIF